jgi:urease subunit alpha
VITNALFMDLEFGIIRCEIGIKHGRIVGIGHGGNRCIQNGIGSVFAGVDGKHDPMIIGACTEVIAAGGREFA